MSEPSDVWQNSAPAGNDSYVADRERSPRRDDDRRDDREQRDREPREQRDRSPRRDRSRSPGARRDAPRGGGGRNDDGSVNSGNNLHVSGLARSITERQLEELFSKYGKIMKAQVMLDPHTQESRGFGFVMLETADEAEAAISALSGSTQEGRVMTVAHAKRGRARTPTPGRYHGVKHEGDGPPRGGSRYGGGGGGYGGGRGYEDRPYQPRSYDSRYSDRGPRYDDRRGGGYDDRRGGYDRYEDRRGGGYDDRRGGGGGGYDDRRGGGYDDRRRPPPPDDYYPDRRDDRGSRYDERPRY